MVIALFISVHEPGACIPIALLYNTYFERYCSSVKFNAPIFKINNYHNLGYYQMSTVIGQREFPFKLAPP